MATMRQPLSFGDDLHAKRVKSLAGATLGAIQSASLAVLALIGQGLALARGRLTKHAVTAGGPGCYCPTRASTSRCPAGALGALRGRQTRQHHGGDGLDRVRRRRSGDDHAVSVVPPRTGHAAGLADRGQGGAEKPSQRLRVSESWVRLAEILPADVRVRIVADRGFGDHKLYRVLTEELKFDFVIRFRGNITVTATSGEARAAADWVGAGGRARTLQRRGGHRRGVSGRHRGLRGGRRAWKEPWCLAASTADEPARALISLCAKRWEIEEWFPRHKGSPVRHGARIDACQHAGPARPACG